MVSRLPVPGQDDGMWGNILNDYLSQAHNADGTLKSVALSAAGGYTKSSNGIPITDLDASVQTSLGKADSALQSTPVSSVAGRTGAVTLTKADVGLTNIDNTSDNSKPVSSATQAALNKMSVVVQHPGDGSDATAAINSAISLLGTTGGVIHFGPGTYGVTSTIFVPGGVLFEGTSIDLGVDNLAPARGSIIQAITGFPIDTTSPLVQLGTDNVQFASGYDGASANYMIFDGAGIAAIALKSYGRRCYISYCQIWRGTQISCHVAGQNTYVLNSWVSGNNAAIPMQVSGSDSKVRVCQIRQAGPGQSQVLVTGLNIELQGNHIYGGANGTVAGTGPSDNIQIRLNSGNTDVGRWRIIDNTLDGTNGNAIHVIVLGASRGRDLLVSGNTIYSVTGMQAASFYPFKLDVTQCSFSFSFREIIFTNNTFNNNIASLYWRSLIGYYAKASGAAVERFLIDGNMGSNAPSFTESYTMRADTSAGTVNGSAVVTDAAIQSTDAGTPITGPGIPLNTFVGPASGITPGTSFKLSSSPSSQVDVFATATATVTVNVGVLNNAWRPDFLGENNGLYANNTTSIRTSNKGMSTQSGNGSKTVFTITHGLGFVPTWYDITAASAAAAGLCYVSADATNLTVSFMTAPSSGTNNVAFAWRATL